MTAVEHAILTTICFAAPVGIFLGHAVGYGRGKRAARPRYRRTGASAAHVEAILADRLAAEQRRRQITRPMPVVPISIGEDVGRPE